MWFWSWIDGNMEFKKKKVNKMSSSQHVSARGMFQNWCFLSMHSRDFDAEHAHPFKWKERVTKPTISSMQKPWLSEPMFFFSSSQVKYSCIHTQYPTSITILLFGWREVLSMELSMHWQLIGVHGVIFNLCYFKNRSNVCKIIKYIYLLIHVYYDN